MYSGSHYNSENQPLPESHAKAAPIQKIEKEFKECSVMIQALWELLKEKGVTEDELVDKITQVNQVRTDKLYQNLRYTCPKCGRNMQETPIPFKLRCLYCHYEIITYPYAKFDDMSEEEANDKINDVTSEKKDFFDDLDFSDFE